MSPVQAPQHIRNETGQKHEVAPVREIALDRVAESIDSFTVLCSA